jgi:nucleoside-diphosphate-sugar epimerase
MSTVERYVVVLGGSGFLGSEVVRSLRMEGVETVVASRFPGPGGLPIDLSRPETFLSQAWAEAHSRMTELVISVGSALPGQSLRSLAVHVEGLNRAAALAKRAPSLRKVVLISSVLAYGEADEVQDIATFNTGQNFSSLYAKAKCTGESMIARCGVPVTVTRPGLLVGTWEETHALQPLPMLLRYLLSHPVLPIENGGKWRAWVCPVEVAADDVRRLVLGEVEASVVLSVDPDSPTMEGLCRQLLRPFAREPLIIDLGKRLQRSRVISQLAQRTGVEREWMALARPWPDIDSKVVARARRGLSDFPPGYLQRAAESIAATYRVACDE